MSIRVLLIDDDEDFRSSVRSFLEARNFDVFEATSGRAGLKAIPRCVPHVIVVDIMMDSDDDGYGVTYSLKNLAEYGEFRHTPVIMVSSIEESPDERFAMSPEAELIRPDRYLTEPLDFDRFAELLEKELGVAVAAP
jgi:two-component system alkaline phosphatase synthesis response regulator PhoP